MAGASLKSIAQELDVSPSLVSKVLSGKLGTTKVTPEVAEQIRRRADELGYRQNRTASALVSGRHGVLAVFIHRHGQPGSAIVSRLTDGLAKGAARARQLLWLQYYWARKDFLAKASHISASNVDGLIVAGLQHEDMIGDLMELQQRGMHVVTIHARPSCPEIPNAGCSEESIGRVGTKHLIERGSRHIAHIGSQADRRLGYRNALAAAGLGWEPELDIEVEDFSYQSGREGTLRLLESGLPFDGIVAQSDHQGLAAMHVLRERGIEIPGQVRIIGVDESPVCELSPIALSSVAQWPGLRGLDAVELLMRLLDGERCESIERPPEARLRDSS